MQQPSYYDMDYEEIQKLAKERLDIDDVEEYGLCKVIDMLSEELPADERFGATLEALQEMWNYYDFRDDSKEKNETREEHLKRLALWGEVAAKLDDIYEMLSKII